MRPCESPEAAAAHAVWEELGARARVRILGAAGTRVEEEQSASYPGLPVRTCLVMLAVMSFNGGVLLAAVAGHALGFLLARSRVGGGAAGGGAAAGGHGHGLGGNPPDGSKA